MKIHVLCGGYLDLDATSFFPTDAGRARWTVPIPCFLVVHPRGRLVFDTGVHRGALADPVGRLGAQRAARFGIRSAPTDEIVSQLGLLGLAPADVGLVANSHLHFDHCGGNEFFPRATFLVQKREMDAARAPMGSVPGYSPSVRDFDHPLEYRLIDGEHDVFGDGQVVLFPTYGHTPGHQSLRITAGKGQDLVLTADACYTRENMDRDLLPGVLWNAGEMSASLARLRDLRDRHGARVVYGHDPGQWQELRRAPEPLA
jgi:glyoxylase-like metal-dependent hydrolase (beta-lactamase superfamily II)